MARRTTAKTASKTAVPALSDDAAAPAPIVVPAPNLDDMDLVEIVKSEETWSSYTLADGSTLRVKPVVAEVLRSRTEVTAEGEPIYLMKGALLPSMRIPKSLRKS